MNWRDPAYNCWRSFDCAVMVLSPLRKAANNDAATWAKRKRKPKRRNGDEPLSLRTQADDRRIDNTHWQMVRSRTKLTKTAGGTSVDQRRCPDANRAAASQNPMTKEQTWRTREGAREQDRTGQDKTARRRGSRRGARPERSGQQRHMQADSVGQTDRHGRGHGHGHVPGQRQKERRQENESE